MPRNAHDYYATPAATIADFITKFREVEPGFDFARAHVLDPASGGCAVYPAAYPTALHALGCTRIDTLDIRPDSRASVIGDYLTHYPETLYDMVITNPPYSSARWFIEAALEDTKPGGFVVMLLRLNYFGAVSRRAFWQANMPTYCFIHSARPRFSGVGTDQCEYAHFVWIAGQCPDHTKTYVI